MADIIVESPLVDKLFLVYPKDWMVHIARGLQHKLQLVLLVQTRWDAHDDMIEDTC